MQYDIFRTSFPNFRLKVSTALVAFSVEPAVSPGQARATCDSENGPGVDRGTGGQDTGDQENIN